jgi:hypothetical protein
MCKYNIIAKNYIFNFRDKLLLFDMWPCSVHSITGLLCAPFETLLHRGRIHKAIILPTFPNKGGYRYYV